MYTTKIGNNNILLFISIQCFLDTAEVPSWCTERTARIESFEKRRMGAQLGWVVTMHPKSPWWLTVTAVSALSFLSSRSPGQPHCWPCDVSELTWAASELYVAQEPHVGPSGIDCSSSLCLMVVEIAVCVLSHYIMQVLQGKKHIPVIVPVKELMGMKYRYFTFFWVSFHVSLAFYNETCFLKFNSSSQ